MKLIGIDTETHPIRPGLKAPPMVCLSHSDVPGGAVLKREPGLDWFEAQLADPTVVLVGHNVAFDLCVIMAARPRLARPIFEALEQDRILDTMIREALKRNATGDYHNRSPSLADLARDYLGKKRSKGGDSWRMRYADLEHLPVERWPRDAVTYAVYDAVDAVDICRAQGGSITDEHPQVRASVALQLMSVWGLRVDHERATILMDEAQAHHDRLQRKLTKAGLVRTSGSENIQAVRERIIRAIAGDADYERAYERASDAGTATARTRKVVEILESEGHELPTTKSGLVSRGEDVLEVIDDPTIQALVEMKREAKRISTYLEPMLDAHGRCLCPSYKTLVRSGRTSSWGPNIQNFPRAGGERECIIPRDGWLLVAADYSTIELRAWATVCEHWDIESQMAQALRDGLDLHASLGAEMLGWSYEYMLEALAGEHGPAAKKRAKQFRQAAKPANFGLPVGMGSGTLAESAKSSYGVDFDELGVSPDEVRDAWYARWTEAGHYFDRIKASSTPAGTRDDGSIDYRTKVEHPVSGRVRGGCFFTEAANSYFQGLAADGAKLALWMVARECYTEPDSPLYGSRPVAFVHDEILMESPEGRVQAAAQRLADVMVEAMTEFVPNIPVLVDCDIMDRWAKGAESEVLEDGTRTIYRSE